MFRKYNIYLESIKYKWKLRYYYYYTKLLSTFLYKIFFIDIWVLFYIFILFTAILYLFIYD